MRWISVSFFLFSLLFFGCEKRVEPLRIYSSMDAKETKGFIEAFEKETGEKVEFVRLSTGEALTRIQSESANPHAAVWIGGGSNEHVILERAGLLEPYQPRRSFPPSPQLTGRMNGWNGWYIGVIGFGANTEFLKKHNMKAPTSYQDLLKPVFKGKIGVAYPYTSGTAYTILASLISLMGEEKGFEFVKALDGQIGHYSESGSACVTQAGLGEVAVCIAFSHDIRHKGIEQGYPLELTFPKEGVGFEVGGASLIKGGPDLERGRRFVDWLFSPTAQNLLAEWNQTPIHPGVQKNPFIVRSETVKKIDVDIYESVERHQQLLARWRQVTGK
ncbi:MAG: ABC transporter substrate-binding protein [Deltaproteobacteria bacterium]|nr:ABC transporter substrate-binding protein [Deltaproteobacteria bacterium]